jgi:adenosine deaminase
MAAASASDMNAAPPVTARFAWGLPKAELHLHLDTSLRPETAVELAKSRKVKIKTGEELIAPDDSPGLVEVLARVEPALAILQDLESLERCAAELAEDLCTDNVVYAEIRFAPELHTRKGLKERAIIEAVWKGLGRGQYKSLRARLIVCALRHMPAENAMKAARCAIDNQDLGIVALDVAGDENAQATAVFAPAFELARSQKLHLTAHAGEAAGPQSVWEALDLLGVTRIGHGVRAIEDMALCERLKKDGIVLENCPTSNIVTKAVANWDAHPAARFLEMGIKVTINSDARTLIRTTATDELVRICRAHQLTRAQAVRLAANSFEGGFDVGPHKQNYITAVLGAK